MATKRIVINVADPLTESLIKSQSKRLTVLERMIKDKKKKSEVSSELRALNSLKSDMARQQLKMQDQSNSLLKALKTNMSRPFTAQVIPSPS